MQLYNTMEHVLQIFSLPHNSNELKWLSHIQMLVYFTKTHWDSIHSKLIPDRNYWQHKCYQVAVENK